MEGQTSLLYVARNRQFDLVLLPEPLRSAEVVYNLNITQHGLGRVTASWDKCTRLGGIPRVLAD
jgi:hypothetical protein